MQTVGFNSCECMVLTADECRLSLTVHLHSQSFIMDLVHDYFIIESLTGDDIKDGKIFYDALNRFLFNPEYRPVKNAHECEEALIEFAESPYKYLFISAHGTSEKLNLIDDDFFIEDLADIQIDLTQRRIFLSTCEGGSTLFGRHFIKKGAYSVVGAPDKLKQIVAAGLWSTMVVVFRRLNDDELNFSELDSTLRLMAKVYQIKLHYYSFRRKHNDQMKEYIYRPSGKRIRNDHDI